MEFFMFRKLLFSISFENLRKMSRIYFALSYDNFIFMATSLLEIKPKAVDIPTNR